MEKSITTSPEELSSENKTLSQQENTIEKAKALKEASTQNSAGTTNSTQRQLSPTISDVPKDKSQRYCNFEAYGTKTDRHHKTSKCDLSLLSLTFGTLGIVYGDIGTSPLYTMSMFFSTSPSKDDVVGATSLILWCLLLVVTFKYVILMLFADNHGEGGVFALLSLLKASEKRMNRFLTLLVSLLAIISASCLFGDGALTPAISILSAVEGIEVIDPEMEVYVVPLTLFIVLLLFVAQQFGTSKVSIMFSPVCFVWFISIGIIGFSNITSAPIILESFNPLEAINFLSNKQSIEPLGAAFLAITGMEALFADMGHFSAASIRW